MTSSPRRPSRLRWLKVAAALVLVLVVGGYGAVSYLVYDGLSKAPRACWPSDVNNTPANFKVPAQFPQSIAQANLMPDPVDVRFQSRDPKIPNAKLAGWWIPAVATSAPAASPAVILIHGIKSCRREPNVLVAAGMLHRNGYSVFLIDLRDHGDSQGDDGRFAGGSNEYLDALGAWDWVRAQGVPAARIGMLGMSFGSITALVAAGQDTRVAAVWSDSAPTTMSLAIGLFLKDQTGLPDILVPGTLLWARVVAGDDLTRFNPIDQLDAFRGRSVAFVHGANDKVLPASMATEMHDRAVAAGATTPEAWIVPGAGHTEAIYVDPAGYEQRLVAFFTAALGGP